MSIFEKVGVGEGQRIRSRLCADSHEPAVGLELTNSEIVTRARSDTQPAEPSGRPQLYPFMPGQGTASPGQYPSSPGLNWDEREQPRGRAGRRLLAGRAHQCHPPCRVGVGPSGRKPWRERHLWVARGRGSQPSLSLAAAAPNFASPANPLSPADPSCHPRSDSPPKTPWRRAPSVKPARPMEE